MSSQIQKAIRYIEKNIDQTITLKEIAKVSGYSPYHFSRIFKQSTGENLFSMIARLRVQRGARDIVYKDSSITMIGIETGYETSTSFNKAFKKQFKMSPSQYKKQTLEALETYQKGLANTPQIIDQEEFTAICTREVGDLHTTGYESWRKLLQHFPTPQGKTFGLIFDNPETTEVDKIRYEACIESEDLTNIPDSFYRKTLPKGKYITYTHQGDLEDLYTVSLQFYGWIIKNNLKIAVFPLTEYYLDDPAELIAGNVNKPTVMLSILLEN
jgi:AraC family transcriptional regulator